MQYRRLGKSGLQVSALSFGSWITFGNQIDNNISEELMGIAYDHGVNFFDNAEIYANGASEVVMGKILKKFNWDRTSYLVSSKVFFGDGRRLPNQTGLNRKHIFEACHDSLRRLQVEYLDLFFCHRPDKITPMEETVWAMNHLLQQGKILYWGTSEWSALEIMEAHKVAGENHLIGPTMEQPQYNMFYREKMENEYLKLFSTVGLGTTIWSPLASGLLTNKYLHGIPKESRLGREELGWLKEKTWRDDYILKASKLHDLAQSLGTSLPILAIAWCIKNPHVSSVILGASKTSQLKETLKALDYVIPHEANETIEEILGNKPILPLF